MNTYFPTWRMRGGSLLLSLFLCLAISAQQPQRHAPQQRFNPQEFQQRMEQAITREAGLTTEEATAFFLLYNEMKQKQRELGEQVRTLKNQTTNNAAATEADYQTAVRRIKQLQVEMAQLEQDYYDRLCRAVPAGKVFKAMQAEDRFHRNMVRQSRHDRRRDQPAR